MLVPVLFRWSKPGLAAARKRSSGSVVAVALRALFTTQREQSVWVSAEMCGYVCVGERVTEGDK